MKRFIGAVLVTALVAVPGTRAADEQGPKAVLDKAIKALGGEANLSKVKAATWKGKGLITFNDNDNAFTSRVTVQGLDHWRQEFEGEFMGNKVKGVLVLAGDKGWRQFGDNQMELDKDAVANEKRNLYLLVVPMKLLPLKGKGFKVEPGKDEKVGGKPAVGLKVTGSDGKDFTLYFDKESGLPVRLVAKVVGIMGDEFTQETTYSDYKDFQGVKKATKIVGKRDGVKFIEQKITDFKVLAKVDPKTFAEPK